MQSQDWADAYGGNRIANTESRAACRAVEALVMDDTLFAKRIKTTELTEMLCIQLRVADSKRPTLGACTQIWLNMLAACDAWELVKYDPVQIDGGEVPALYLLEALIRKIPDVLGNPESLKNLSFWRLSFRPNVFCR